MKQRWVIRQPPSLALPSLVLLLLFFFYILFNIRVKSLLLASPTNHSITPTKTPHTETKFSILIGILTRPDNYDRRHLLRLVYGIQSSSTAQIDVKNMNNGKTHAYFSSLPRILPRHYDYVMKADDDVFIRLEPLSSSLKPLPRQDLDGVFAVVGPCRKWIGMSEIPANHTFGPEDKMVGKWLKMGNKAKNRFSNKPGMYDYPGTNGRCSHELIPETVAVHRLKRRDQWLHVLEFFNVTKQLNHSKLYHL
ncbi:HEXOSYLTRANSFERASE [Salix viminalis]|uniref:HEXOSYLTRANSFERASE n=1 Tax=Salix viminalis TaxID=40686 RepID=A0A9Q0NXB8_SALVM|nr:HEXOSYLTRANSFERASE [Salix viminalis]